MKHINKKLTEQEVVEVEEAYHFMQDRIREIGFWQIVINNDESVGECSNCGKTFYVDEGNIRDIYKFCPNCGAKMLRKRRSNNEAITKKGFSTAQIMRRTGLPQRSWPIG